MHIQESTLFYAYLFRISTLNLCFVCDMRCIVDIHCAVCLKILERAVKEGNKRFPKTKLCISSKTWCMRVYCGFSLLRNEWWSDDCKIKWKSVLHYRSFEVIKIISYSRTFDYPLKFQRTTSIFIANFILVVQSRREKYNTSLSLKIKTYLKSLVTTEFNTFLPLTFQNLLKSDDTNIQDKATS